MILVLIAPFAMNAQNGSKDMWDFVTSFSCSTGRQHAVVYDGEYIYTAAWGKSSSVLYMFYKYDMEGTLLDQFDVPGVTNSDNYVRDLTYDGIMRLNTIDADGDGYNWEIRLTDFLFFLTIMINYGRLLLFN